MASRMTLAATKAILAARDVGVVGGKSEGSFTSLRSVRVQHSIRPTVIAAYASGRIALQRGHAQGGSLWLAESSRALFLSRARGRFSEMVSAWLGVRLE